MPKRRIIPVRNRGKKGKLTKLLGEHESDITTYRGTKETEFTNQNSSIYAHYKFLKLRPSRIPQRKNSKDKKQDIIINSRHIRYREKSLTPKEFLAIPSL
jgi:hypothetical protein